MRGWFGSVDRYWFSWGSPVALGAYRIVLGFLAFWNLIAMLPDWSVWFTPEGFVPRSVSRVYLAQAPAFGIEIPRINLLVGTDDPRITLPFYLIVTFCALLTSLGLFSKISSTLLAIGIVSLQHRNPLVLHGGDVVLRVMTLYVAMAPSGAAWSLDAWIKRRRNPQVATPISPLWTQRLIAYNVSLVYLTTVWLKWGGSMWRDGTATYYPNRLAEFYRFPVPEFLLNPPFTMVMTYATLIVEFSMVTLVYYRPFRKWCLLGGLLMHGFIEYSMNIPLFSYLMVGSYIAFYDGEEVQRWYERLRHRFLPLYAKSS